MARCLRCGFADLNMHAVRWGDRWDCYCPLCGEYSISVTDREEFITGRADPKKAQFKFAHTSKGRRYLLAERHR